MCPCWCLLTWKPVLSAQLHVPLFSICGSVTEGIFPEVVAKYIGQRSCVEHGFFRNSRSPTFSYLFRNTVLWFPNQKTNLSYINIDPQIFPKIREFSKIPFTLISYFNFIIWVNIELFILHFYEIINLNVIVKISLLLICQL